MTGAASAAHGGQTAPGARLTEARGEPYPDAAASRAFGAARALVLLCSAALMVAAARGDLWLDEIWSLMFARRARSIADIFLEIKHDNNHPLNTLYLYLVRGDYPFLLYRLFAIGSGVASLLLIGEIARRRWGELESLCAVLLAGTSYPLILYFSEARGYAPAICCALACCAVLQGAGDSRWPRVLPFWGISVLGVLSHSTFAVVSASFLAADFAAALRRPHAVRSLLVYHVPPLAFFTAWYLFFVRNMLYGGGPTLSYPHVAAQASAMLLGLPDAMPLALPLLAALAVGAIGILLLRRESADPGWVFFPAVLFLFPALLLIAARPRYLYFRYFLVSFPFFHLLLARTIGIWYRGLSPARRWLPAASAALLVAAQLPRIATLVTFGRGGYRAALARIATESGGAARIGSDNDSSNRPLFNFYRPFVPGGRGLRYVEGARWREEGMPEWLLMHFQDPRDAPAPRLMVEGSWYRFTAGYPCSGVSGVSWHVFRREDEASAPPRAAR